MAKIDDTVRNVLTAMPCPAANNIRRERSLPCRPIYGLRNHSPSNNSRTQNARLLMTNVANVITVLGYGLVAGSPCDILRFGMLIALTLNTTATVAHGRVPLPYMY